MPPFQNVEFVTASTGDAGTVAVGEQQVVFAGRSNVGKSSLINALAGRKVARTSSQPGATRTINFFRVAPKFWFVDLPGYGYAKASREARVQWGRWVFDFLSLGSASRLSLVVVDGVVGPTPLDLEAITLLSGPDKQAMVVATKWDQVSKSRRRIERERLERAVRSAAELPLVTVSSKTGEGMRELAKHIADFFARSLASQSKERKAQHETDDARSAGGCRARRG